MADKSPLIYLEIFTASNNNLVQEVKFERETNTLYQQKINEQDKLLLI